MLIELESHQKRQYDKFRISIMDIAHALQCARFLIKKGWHSHEWERRGTIYLQQSAFTTSLVVSYARPFTPARGLSGLQARLIKWTVEEKALHDRILTLRNEVYAHSDGASYSFQPWQAEGLTTVIEMWPQRRLSKEDTLAFEAMATRILAALRERMRRIFPAH
ncbi:hypothetical protein [Agrobacterium burrii]|uniref:HEPN AbiU2-like domain-containing protein n=1 Tax=Agrobacterium burrii TaxID=2815339 RepID=A0ABS3EQB4_9HYPH|nr:hypothetical protein [Agrobacterium burrii]MBO0134159.1 hypothetical protein [Agrobacterium burrii]